MKYYETNCEEYIQTSDKYTIHPEFVPVIQQMPDQITQFSNLILFGPSGSGKYTQALNIIRKYSPSKLKYEKKIAAQTNKNNEFNYTFHISDIHYEIDMSLLGCNSKTTWHDLYFQIVDIISIKPNKTGIILCENFHNIHNELLEVFYSYIQHTRMPNTNIHIKFIILSDHVSFIPNNILNGFTVLSIPRPTKRALIQLEHNVNSSSTTAAHNATNTTTSSVQTQEVPVPVLYEQFLKRVGNTKRAPPSGATPQPSPLLSEIEPNCIMNLKEIPSFSLITDDSQIPKDIFNIVCDNIIHEILHHQTLKFTAFRDSLYDILVYNLDITDCLWYILHYFLYNGHLKNSNVSLIMEKIHTFLKQYNNNYRPIYHLESIFFYLLLQVNDYPNKNKSI